MTRRSFAAPTVLSAALLQLLLLASTDGLKGAVPLSNSIGSSAFSVGYLRQENSSNLKEILSLRGGDDDYDDSSSTLDVEIDVDEIESSDEDEVEDEEEELDPKLVRAAQAASSKVKATAIKAATAASKKAVASTLLASKPKPKKEKSGLAKLFHIPYIIKACLNPFIFIQMTTEYWRSLINHKYGEAVKDTSQDLRSSLQDKARKGGGGNSSTRKKRKMKPGQAKTLSDLPQLNT
ncbi:hypothetical protein IV203_006034 [Nitzschia inconspicua]|uniref:Uncharacterized protein n=1 Tax=Nitzschia inconspicua TaxID=303405 RepID=A0A9K3KPZ0_9STRA|nr:hypothetical protein IV203_006034 [Nitzschia inconspicua]